MYTGKGIEIYLCIYNCSCCKLKMVIGQIDVMKLIFLSGSPRLMNIGCFSDLLSIKAFIQLIEGLVKKCGVECFPVQKTPKFILLGSNSEHTTSGTVLFRPQHE